VDLVIPWSNLETGKRNLLVQFSYCLVSCVSGIAPSWSHHVLSEATGETQINFTAVVVVMFTAASREVLPYDVGSATACAFASMLFPAAFILQLSVSNELWRLMNPTLPQIRYVPAGIVRVRIVVSEGVPLSEGGARLTPTLLLMKYAFTGPAGP